MQCLDTLGGEGGLAYTNPSRDFIVRLSVQMYNRLNGPRQREEVYSHIKRSNGQSSNPSPSSTITIDDKFDLREQGKTHIPPP